MSRHGRDRLRLVISTADRLNDAVKELTLLGAFTESAPDGAQTLMRDLDGNEFRLVAG